MKLSYLISRLEHTVCPMELFSMYQGTDWKQHVRYNTGSTPAHVILHQSNAMKLVLYGWHPNQVLSHQNHYSTMYTKLMAGTCTTSMLYPNHHNAFHRTLYPPMMVRIPPFSKYTFTATSQEPTASLMLFHYTDTAI